MSEERPKPATGDISREESLFSSSRYSSLVTNISGMLTISFSYKILLQLVIGLVVSVIYTLIFFLSERFNLTQKK